MKNHQNKLSRAHVGSFVVGLAALAAGAFAQAGSVEFASGLPHTSLGGATIGPAEGRRLPVHNIGSSGQDGVEIHLNSMFGGGVTIDAGSFSATPGSEIKIKHKGWDGLIYGTHRSISGGGGGSGGFDEFDFSPLGATSIEVVDYDSTGHPISTNTIPGPFGGVPWVGQVIQCPPPCSWQPVVFWGMVNGKWHYAIGHRCMCPGTGGDGGTGTQWDRLVTPSLPPGIEPPLTGSLLVTASGMPEFAAVDSSIGTYGLSSLGLGTAHISEQCDSPVGCSADERKLVVSNIGSSGQDGVAIDLGKNGGVQWRRTDTCCPSPGHTTLTRLIGSDGHPFASLTESPNGSLTDQNITCDFSALGASGVGIRCLDENGLPIAYLEYALTATVTIRGPRCPPGMYWGLRNPPNLGWGCMHYMDLVLPGGTAVPGAFMVEFVALGVARAPQARIIETTTTGVSGFTIERPTVLPPPCVADVDDGTGTGSPDYGVTIDDLLYYLFIFEAGDPGADVDDGSFTGTLDGGVTIDDLLYYLFRFEAGC